MGAKQSFHTTKTFINVSLADRGSIDDSFTTDPRLNKTWGGMMQEDKENNGVDANLDCAFSDNSKPFHVNQCGGNVQTLDAVEKFAYDVGLSVRGSKRSTASATDSLQSESRPPLSAESEVDRSTWTARMLRNIPNDYRRDNVLQLLDAKGVKYDFIYLPMDWGRRTNLGYVFVNLVSPAEAIRVESVLGGFSGWTTSSEKRCEVAWGQEDQQSLRLNVERFRNSPVMHSDVPEEFKPLIFTLGRRSTFPPPSKRIRPPREFQRKIAVPVGQQ